MRSEYWEEKAAVSVPAGVGGLPVFYTLENFKPRKSALIGGSSSDMDGVLLSVSRSWSR